MLKQVDALPCSNAWTALDHRNGKLNLSERRVQMRRHVVGAFVVMATASRSGQLIASDLQPSWPDNAHI